MDRDEFDDKQQEAEFGAGLFALVNIALIVTIGFLVIRYALGCNTAKGEVGYMRTANFIVYTTDPNQAVAIADAAERLRREISIEWFGAVIPDGAEQCVINVSKARYESGLFWPRKPEATRDFHNLYLSVTESRRALVILPHEIAHLVLRASWPEIPAWLNEGIASRYDPQDRKRRRAEIVAWWSRIGRRINFDSVREAKSIPAHRQESYVKAVILTQRELLKWKNDKRRMMKELMK